MKWCRAQLGSARGGLVMALALAAWACGKDGVVGGSCRKGLTECSLQCVDLQQDAANCGVCGHACASSQRCSAGSCGNAEAAADATEDGWRPDDVTPGDVAFPDVSGDGASDGSTDGAGDGAAADVRDGSPLDAGDVSVADGGNNLPDGAGDGAAADVGDDSSPDGPTCMPPYDTPEHCGDCMTKCVDPTPLCGLQGTFKCVAKCDPPLVACGSICVNTSSDETNCGTCSMVCPSGICQAGGCVGKGYGHEILIGMDYADPTLSATSAQVTMLGNAILQSVATNVRVLAYDEFADPPSVTRIEGWLSTMAAARGKSVTITKAPSWSAVPTQLTIQQYQAFLVYDQAIAPANQMATTGTLWNGAMDAFARGGGIIVALDGGSLGGMKDLLNNGGLLAVTSEADVTGTQLDVAAPTDVVGQNLPNVFAAKKTTVAFTTPQMRDNYHVFVVTDSTGMLPVVVHSVPTP